VEETPLLAVSGLHVMREGTPILRGVSLRVSPGEVVGVLGRNGAGKSTLAYALMGLPAYRPHRGKILFRGEDVEDWTISDRAKAGITLAWQHPARYEGIPVRDYLRISRPRSSEAELADALDRVQLESRYLDRMVDKALSGGERKRIELASVYLMKPKLSQL